MALALAKPFTSCDRKGPRVTRGPQAAVLVIDDSFAAADILTNCRSYPRDEAPAAYKDFEEVLRSVKLAGLASEVARLQARFVIKDGDQADD